MLGESPIYIVILKMFNWTLLIMSYESIGLFTVNNSRFIMGTKNHRPFEL